MTLSFSKFMVTTYTEIRCTVCGVADEIGDTRLDTLVEWAEQHECPRMAVT